MAQQGRGGSFWGEQRLQNCRASPAVHGCSSFDEMSDLKSFWKNRPTSFCRRWQISHIFQYFFFFKRKFRQENGFILFCFSRLFLSVSNHLVPQERADCLLLYTHINAENLETFISSFLVSPALELPETLSTKLKPSLFQQYLHYTGTQTAIKFRSNTNSGSFHIFFPGHGRFCL